MFFVTKEHLTPMVGFRVINERNFTLSTGMSFFVLCPYKCTGVALIIGI
jgi:hypothetical protein